MMQRKGRARRESEGKEALAPTTWQMGEHVCFLWLQCLSGEWGMCLRGQIGKLMAE